AADQRRGRLAAAALDVEDLDVEPFLLEEALGLGQRGGQIDHQRDAADADGDFLGGASGRRRGRAGDERQQNREGEDTTWTHAALLFPRGIHRATGFQYEKRASR